MLTKKFFKVLTKNLAYFKKDISKISLVILLTIIQNSVNNLKIFMNCFKIINKQGCVILNSGGLKKTLDLNLLKKIKNLQKMELPAKNLVFYIKIEKLLECQNLNKLNFRSFKLPEINDPEEKSYSLMFKDPKNYLFLVNYHPKENFNLIKNIKKSKAFFKTDSLKIKKNSLLNTKKESLKNIIKKKFDNSSIISKKKSIISAQKPKNLSQNQKKNKKNLSNHFDIQTPDLKDGFNIYKRIKERTKISKINKKKKKKKKQLKNGFKK